MTNRAAWLPLIGLSALGAVAVFAWAQSKPEGPIPLDQVPAPVKAAILRESAGGEIKEIEAETEDGKTIYEVEFVRDGKSIEIAIAADGTLQVKEDEERAAESEEQERKVSETEVPAAALAALKKLAAAAKITEFAEEVEHGGKFYEGSWKAASGSNVDALVTSAGDIVEIEEELPADQVPAGVLAAVRRLAGKDASLFCEKKTLILYEVKFRKDDQRYEILYAPDGRVLEKSIEKGGGEKDD